MADLSTKDRVAIAWDKTRCGRVVRAGPEQSEVRLDSEHKDQCFLNSELVPLGERIRSSRTAGARR